MWSYDLDLRNIKLAVVKVVVSLGLTVPKHFRIFGFYAKIF